MNRHFKMEAAAQITSTMNLGVLKEPRGFIKVIQWILSIFAFATTTSFNTHISYQKRCPNSTKYINSTFNFAYPFDLEHISLNGSQCAPAQPQMVHLGQGAVSSSQFYVFVGVIVFLYCIAGLILYIFFDDLYRKNTRIVVADFIISLVLTALWLIGSSAWAQGVSDVKYYTDLKDSGLFHHMSDCRDRPESCKVIYGGNFAGLNISIIFGFLNFGVWVGNLWFLYKETPWFKVTSKPPSAPGPDAASKTETPANVY